MKWKQFLSLLKELKFLFTPMIVPDYRPRVSDQWIIEQTPLTKGDEI